MKIVIVTQYFWPESFRINYLAQELLDKGHEITVYTGLPNYPKGKVYLGYGFFGSYSEDYNGLIIKRIPIIPRGENNKLLLVLNYISYVFFASLFLPFRLRDNYDVTFVYVPSPISVCLPAILLKKIYKTPIIIWVQDLWPESLSATGAVKSKIILRLVKKLVHYIYQSCDLILVQSKGFIKSVEQFGINNNKIRYFPNSAEKIYKPANDLDLGLYNEELPKGFRVVFAGNIGAAQSIETIIDAADILKMNDSIKLIFIGDGRVKSWLEQEIINRKLSNTVFALGRKPMEDMPNYFSVSDVLLATLKKEEIFALTIPSKIQSYLACSKPIVTAIDGTASDIINESGAGIAVEAEDSKALADAILIIYKKSEADRQKMGWSGRKYFQDNFDSDKLLGQLEEWMQEVVA